MIDIYLEVPYFAKHQLILIQSTVLLFSADSQLIVSSIVNPYQSHEKCMTPTRRYRFWKNYLYKSTRLLLTVFIFDF